jgi:hypothetical protein
MKRRHSIPSRKWLLLAFVPSGGREKRLHFDGKNFTTKGKARRFDAAVDAANFGRRLRARFPVLAKVRLRVEPVGAPHLSGFKRNPADYRSAVDKYAAELDAADKLLNDFSGHRSHEVLSVRERPIKAGLVVGDLLGVMYATTRDGKRLHYCHEFKHSSRPLLVANHDGSRIGIVGGRYRFTDKGIEDA